ncbi:phosphatase PAP2 family protein [bacterium]|nr:phosphatase PAP2 family protein [bacterium]
MKKFSIALISFSLLFAREPNLIDDAAHFYTKDTAVFLGAALLPAAIMANTSIDAEIDDTYQFHVRSSSTDKCAKIAKIAGSNMPLTIAFVSGITASYIFKDTTFGKNVYDYTMNTFRATITGFPLLVTGQVLLGGDRPSSYTHSYWQPFQNDHGISGHTYMGAIPFITAANMVKNPILKGIFYVASTATGLSRINDEAHYPSQVLLGWCLAYASCNAIKKANLSINASANSFTLNYQF